MEEHIAFERPKNPPPTPPLQQSTTSSQGQSHSPSSSQTPPMPDHPPTPPAEHVPLSLPHDDEPFSIPFLVKVLAGLGIAALLIFLFLRVIVPFFQKPTDTKITLTYWGLWEDKEIMKSIITDFERTHPTITIDYTKQDPHEYLERVLVRSQNGNGPDIFRFHNSWVPVLLHAGDLLPLSNDVITKDAFQQTYYPTMQTDLIKQGAIYGIPLTMDTLSLFVNTSLFKAAGVDVPVTWNDFMNVSRDITVQDANGTIKTAGAALGTMNNITHAPDIVSLLFAQNGADLSAISDHTQSIADALNFYNSFTNNQASVWDSNLDPSLDMFARGNLGMYFGYSWDIFAIKAMNPSLSFTIHPVPHLPNRAISIASYWVEGGSARSKHPKEVLLFLQYLAQKDVAQKLYSEEAKTRQFGELYARMDLAKSLTKDPQLAPFITQAKTAVSSPFVGETQDTTRINAQMNSYLANAVNSLLTNTSAQSATDTLVSGVTQVQKQYDNP